LSSSIQEMYLLADSQLLFWRPPGGDSLLRRVRATLDAVATTEPRAAYVGASNGDQPAFYDLFRGAMAGIDVTACRMIPAEPTAEDLDFVRQAHLILLAGGDPKRGWDAFEANGLDKLVVERYAQGVVLMGVSAGAVQLGLQGWQEADDGEGQLFETFRLVPYLIDAHAEPEWPRMHRALPRLGRTTRGLGLPTGGGAVVHPDLTIEPIRHPLTEFSLEDRQVHEALLFPPDPNAPQEEEGEAETFAPPVRRTASTEAPADNPIIDIEPESVN
jgi:hypothetical protein